MLHVLGTYMYMSVPLFRYICVLGYTCIRSSYYVSVFKRIAGAKRNYNSDRNTCTCTYTGYGLLMDRSE